MYYQNGVCFLEEKEKDSCCICYEDTHYRTSCNHSICIECMEKIKKFPILCPMCRKNL